MQQTDHNGRSACGAYACACSQPAAGSHDCVSAADALLAQAAGLIESVDDGTFCRACSGALGGTIGKHIRHCLDHFAAALAGYEDGGLIDYDHRERDVPMETCRRTAGEAVRRLRARLAGLDGGAMEAPVTVRVMLSEDGRTADLRSTLGRELAFATHHAVHHHAMMKFIADSFGLETPAGFGKAPSTLHHERQSAATLKS